MSVHPPIATMLEYGVGHSALLCAAEPAPWSYLFLGPAVCSSPHHLYVLGPVISCTMFAVSGHLLYYVRSLWSSPVLCSQSLVISFTMSAVSGHLLYYVRSLWSSPVVRPHLSVISCSTSAVSGHLL
ncbi:unnamed protein product [Staurois parvus]|uniref:Uncharacterized protein n=1 Tax=Staurois parvus TaxID=386267 RepID=A0ABN9FG93_9NEOB|nr:unnamed protein product [Staurois parvus]